METSLCHHSFHCDLKNDPDMILNNLHNTQKKRKHRKENDCKWKISGERRKCHEISSDKSISSSSSTPSAFCWMKTRFNQNDSGKYFLLTTILPPPRRVRLLGNIFMISRLFLFISVVSKWNQVAWIIFINQSLAFVPLQAKVSHSPSVYQRRRCKLRLTRRQSKWRSTVQGEKVLKLWNSWVFGWILNNQKRRKFEVPWKKTSLRID